MMMTDATVSHTCDERMLMSISIEITRGEENIRLHFELYFVYSCFHNNNNIFSNVNDSSKEHTLCSATTFR